MRNFNFKLELLAANLSASTLDEFGCATQSAPLTIGGKWSKLSGNAEPPGKAKRLSIAIDSETCLSKERLQVAGQQKAAFEMAPYLLLFFIFVTCGLVNMTRPRNSTRPMSERDTENAYKAAFKIESKETVERRKLISLLLVIALLIDMLLVVWIFRFA